MNKITATLLLVLSILFVPTTVIAETEQPFNSAENVEQKLDLNTATVDQLLALPGIGRAKAQAIVEYRETTGPFLEVAQLTEVKGIGEKILSKMQIYITVSQ